MTTWYTRVIDGTDSIYDSREIQDRIDHLSEIINRAPAQTAELESLLKFAIAVKECSDEWEHGITFVRYSYTTEYVKEYAEDTYDADERRWPFNHVDWDSAAEEFFSTGSCVDLRGIPYSFV